MPVVTAADIEAHLVCPRQYEFAQERPVSPRQQSQAKIRERRRELLCESIVAGLRVETTSPADRIDAAFERLNTRWESSRQSYLVPEQARYDKAVLEAAIETYLTEDGQAHGEQLVVADTTVGYKRRGIRYEATVDAVVERDGRYLALRYVPDMSGILHVSWYDTNVERFTDGRGFYPRQIGSFARAAITIQALTDEYGLAPTYDFAYVSLLGNNRPAYDLTSDVHVDLEQRHFEDTYATERQEIQTLIEERAGAILAGKTDPTEWRFDAITDRSCGYCPYQDACPDYMASKLAFTDRRETPAAEPSVNANPTENDQ